MSDVKSSNRDDEPEPYEPPVLTAVGEFGKMTKGSYSRGHSDDGDAGGYWQP